jgi:hypothetical protein
MGRSIMIVGNGEIDAAAAAHIDNCDLVFRFNDCRSVGPGGTRTDIVVVCNTGRPGHKMLNEPGWTDNRAVTEASAIWCIRDPQKFAALRPQLAVSHPELDDFCDDHTDGFAGFAAAAGKSLHVVSATTHTALDAELAAFAPAPYVVPSTGAVAIAEVVAHVARPDDCVTLAGFSHQGWQWHPWDAERQWVDGLVARHKLHRLRHPESMKCV